jgi:hypothetical protein
MIQQICSRHASLSVSAREEILSRSYNPGADDDDEAEGKHCHKAMVDIYLLFSRLFYPSFLYPPLLSPTHTL